MIAIVVDGITHELTKDELKVLKIALNGFNDCDLPFCSEAREREYLNALQDLKNIVRTADAMKRFG